MTKADISESDEAVIDGYTIVTRNGQFRIVKDGRTVVRAMASGKFKFDADVTDDERTMFAWAFRIQESTDALVSQVSELNTEVTELRQFKAQVMRAVESPA